MSTNLEMTTEAIEKPYKSCAIITWFVSDSRTSCVSRVAAYLLHVVC